MAATGLIALVSGGGLGVAVAILFALSIVRIRRRSAGPVSQDADPELAAAMAQIQADIEKGRRGY
jgi:hypothetical protein